MNIGRTDEARRVKAILWRIVNLTVIDALTGKSYSEGGGGKHIPIPASVPVERFLNRPPYRTEGKKREWTIPVHAHNGATKDIVIAYDVRGEKERKEWLVRRQYGSDQHPAWAPGGKLKVSQQSREQDKEKEFFLLLLRLADDSFHARVLTRPELDDAPARVRQAIEENPNAGVLEL